MAGFNESIGRSDTIIPEPVALEIIQQLPEASVMLNRARRVQMSSKTLKQPVLAALPDAYWLNGDSDNKQTTKAEWENLVITAEELAVLVAVPDAVIDDSSVPIWDELRPLLVEAIGKAVDSAALFGVNKPATWPTAVVPAAIAAGNVVEDGTNADFAGDVAAMAGLVSEDGFSVDGFASQPGLQWRMIGLRSADGVPIYTPSLSAGAPAGLFGFQLNEVKNGSWQNSAATLLGADWSKFVVGVRQDITFTVSDSAVITDNAGNVVYNAYQQDGKIMRVVFRVGFQVANPLTRVGGATRYPAGVVTPAVP